MKDPLRDAGVWLREAEVDASLAAEISEDFPSRACFHAQQAAEKALKALLYAAGERPVLGYSLADLGGDVVRHLPSYEELRVDIAKLDRFYIPTRYPNGLPEGALPSESFDQSDATSATDVARKAIDHARRFIEQRTA